MRNAANERRPKQFSKNSLSEKMLYRYRIWIDSVKKGTKAGRWSPGLINGE